MGNAKYIVKRLCYMILTILAVATVTFFLMRSIPGDPLANMARALPEQTKLNFYAKYGLDKPLIEQYFLYMKGLLHFDLGESLVFAGRSVAGEIAKTSPISGLLPIPSILSDFIFNAFFSVASFTLRSLSVFSGIR